MKTATLLILLVPVFLGGCAETTFYGNNGKKRARFQGDMTKVHLRLHADGSAEWSADAVNHSAATKEGGEAVAKNVRAVGTAGVAAGILPGVPK